MKNLTPCIAENDAFTVIKQMQLNIWNNNLKGQKIKYVRLIVIKAFDKVANLSFISLNIFLKKTNAQ